MLKTRINKIENTEEVRYEIYIPKESEASILIYLDEDAFLSLLDGLTEFGTELKKQEGINV
ncbi:MULTISPECIES: hypothetical protein [Leptospira]|uniref:Uncharacterized protein n=1 Tax=Leptospira kirschneri str. H1 TaxID=1049966 RepID=A0A0E2B6B8_9LEPT|nr:MULTISPECIES: hypothetical protein [Leptospira]EKO16387.1 hypothetical protein LEP1GSC081_1334 [Leptospira kirschneri str. H1]ULG86581.1 hypothetical protein FH594_21135 [Leptospira interrogans]UML78772.1 hypothetical protein FH602_01820 [Leptospira kirschneri]